MYGTVTFPLPLVGWIECLVWRYYSAGKNPSPQVQLNGQQHLDFGKILGITLVVRSIHNPGDIRCNIDFHDFLQIVFIL